MNDLALAVKATLSIYLDCIKHASYGFIKNWNVLLASVFLFFTFMVCTQLFGGLGLIGGFILGLISALFTAQYYSWLAATVEKDRLAFKDLAVFDAGMFFSVISVSFLLFIIYYLVSPMGRNEETAPVLYIIYLFIVFGFNALPEVVYLQRSESLHAFSEALRFTKENWIEWYLPFIILVLPLFFANYDPAGLIVRFALLSPLFPGVLILTSWAAILSSYPYLGILVGFLLSHWFMLFRGCLFKELASGTRRRRIYLARQK